MASCKDCICSEVCYYKAFNDEKHLKKRRNDVEKICKSFVHCNSLKNAPTVYAVEVVRCKDCKQYDCIDYDYGLCRKSKFLMKNDDFCSLGERKDNG